jgi:hypothetical protein
VSGFSFHQLSFLFREKSIGVTDGQERTKHKRNEMNQEIDRINQALPNTPADEKADAIERWIRSVINRIKRYKAEHNQLLKENMTLLELALWKAKLENNANSVPHIKTE